MEKIAARGTSFTPGPWMTRRSGDGSGDIGITAPGLANVLAECFAAMRSHDERAMAEVGANAALIAAAPDFAAGVEMMITGEEAGGESWWRGWGMLKAAYRKAGLDHPAPWFQRESRELSKPRAAS